ncbi:M35 protein [Murid betaherpesvirus 1]|nr:M35 protein [Murid betaherpesvirus 1]
MAAPTEEDPRRDTSLMINERCNFPQNMLSEENINFIQDAVCNGDLGAVAALNSGLPMAPYMLEALLAVRVKHRLTKVRQTLEPVIWYTVSVAHLINGTRILRSATAKHATAWGPNDKHRAESGLRRIYRALNLDDNPFDLIEAVGDLDLSQGAYEGYVRHIYSLMKSLGHDVGHLSRSLDYSTMTVFNYLYESPLFTSQEAVTMYSRNLAGITKMSREPFETLSVVHRSKEPPEILNDMLFLLSVGRMIVLHQESLRALRKNLILTASALCSMLYTAYTQVPETKSLFREVAQEAHALLSSRSPDTPNFRPFVACMLQFIKQIIAADVYTCPRYLTNQILAVTARMHGLEGAAMGHDDDLDIEVDPGNPYSAKYRMNNPYNDQNIFKCPRSLVHYVGDALFKKTMTQELLVSCTDQEATYQTYELPSVSELVGEGVAKRAHLTPDQLSHYLSVVSTPVEVVTDDIEDGEQEEDLFADVSVAPASPVRPIRGGGQRMANMRGARPYSTVQRGRRRHESEV